MALTKVSNQVIQTPYKKNFIINGCARLWQRGFGPVSTNGAYLGDRFKLFNNSSTTLSYYRSDAGPVTMFQKSFFLKVTAGQATIPSDKFAGLLTEIEGYDYRFISGQTVTLSFWVRSSTAGIYCASFRTGSPSVDRSYIAEYTINSVDTWEYKTITAVLNGNNTPSYEEGRGLQISWCLACGADSQGTAGSWLTGSKLATSNQVNFLSTLNVEFRIAGMQLELGPVATPFEYRPFGEELILCQRYYEKSYAIGVSPGTSTLTGELAYIAPTTGTVYQNIIFKVSKRVNPTGTVYLYSTTGAINNVRDITTGADVAASGVVESNHSAIAQFTATAGRLYGFQWVADAEFT